MRISRWKTLLLFSLLSTPAVFAAEAPVAADALASPGDIVVFDDSPAAADPLETVELEDAAQSAFPVFYGTLPATPSQTPAVPRTREPIAPPALSALPPLPAQPSLPAQPEATGDIAAAPEFPIPLPPPAELLAGEGASALPASQGSAAPVPSIAANAPPPLPELPAALPGEPAAAIAKAPDIYSPPAPPKTLEQVRAEFAALKTYCEADSLGSAAEIYAQMPDFGEDDEMNRLRADAANLLILGLARGGNLMAARRVYDSVPAEMAGFDARLAKARAVINLATYYIRAQQYNDAFAVLMDAGKIQNRSALNNELFRLMARMIPYLDNAEETDKAKRIYDLLLSEVKSPGTAALFAENVRASVLTYYFHYVDNSDSPVHRRKRLDFLEHVFFSLDALADNPDVRDLKYTLGTGLADRYAGDPDRAARFAVEL